MIESDVSIVLQTQAEATLDSYPNASLAISIAWYGPTFPLQAFDNVETLDSWYQTVVHCWKKDCVRPNGLTLNVHFAPDDIRLEPRILFREALKSGIRRLQDNLFGKLHDVRVSEAQEIIDCCRLFHRVIQDDETLVKDRHALRVKIDKGLADALIAENYEDIVHQATGGYVIFNPDDSQLLRLWATIARINDPSTHPTVESESAENPPPKAILEHTIPAVWRFMRQLGDAWFPEPPRPADVGDIRRALDQVIASPIKEVQVLGRDSEHMTVGPEGGDGPTKPAIAGKTEPRKRKCKKRGPKPKPWSEREKDFEFVMQWEWHRSSGKHNATYASFKSELEDWMSQGEVTKRIQGYYRWETRLLQAYEGKPKDMTRENFAEGMAPGMGVPDLNTLLGRARS